MAYDEDCGISRDLYSVKTQKILEISNIIASSSNIIYTVFSKDIRKLDIGGLAVTLYRIYKEDEIKKKIKREFVYGSYYDMIKGDF